MIYISAKYWKIMSLILSKQIMALENLVTEKKKFDVNKIREDFPILSREIYGKPLVYLDNAATTQKPKQVIEKLVKYYSGYNSNIHRGVHYLSQKSTTEYDKARSIIQKFINAEYFEEIVFTRGATESVNLVASSWGRHNIGKGDEIVITHMEHHANIVPWQMLCREKDAVLKVIPINDAGELIVDELENLVTEKTKLISFVHISNSLGTVNPAKQIIDFAHSRNIPVLLDGAQSVQHTKIDVRELGCDFFVASGHKIYGPTGIGFLYGKKDILESMQPYQTGGDMISTVSFEKTTFNELPYKFEAGTPNIAGAIGLGEAIKYIENLGLGNIAAYEEELLSYGTSLLQSIDGLRIIGTAKNKSSILSFVLDNAHPHDVGTILDMDGIAIRTGQHCTEPVMHRFGIPATSRASISFYNTKEELDVLANSIINVIKTFS